MKKRREWFIQKNSKENLLFLGCILTIAICSFLIWRRINVFLGITGYLNVDDLCSIQFALAGDTIVSKLHLIIQNDPTNVPLFYILLSFWLRLFGFYPNTIRILPEILAGAFIVVAGLSGQKILNRKMGILMAVLAGSSIQLIYAGYQIRSYSLLMLCSALVFYVWLCKKTNRIFLFFMTGALLLVSFSHFFGVLVCAALGSWDLICCLFKVKSKKRLLPYIGYAVLFAPYLIISYLNAKEKWGVFWPPVPGYMDFCKMLESLCVGKNIGFVIFCITACFYLLLLANKYRSRNVNVHLDENIMASFWVVFTVLIIGFVYSRYINPVSSVWVYRYFLVLYPFVLVILAYAVSNFGIWVKNKFLQYTIIYRAFVLAFAFLYTYRNIEYAVMHVEEINTGGSDYVAISECLITQEDINSDDTLVYFPYPDIYFDGWIGFYTQDEKIEKPNICCTEEELRKLELTKYRTIYTVEVVYEMTEQQKAYIEETHSLMAENYNNVEKINKYSKK